jgi:hypothetical protein
MVVVEARLAADERTHTIPSGAIARVQFPADPARPRPVDRSAASAGDVSTGHERPIY